MNRSSFKIVWILFFAFSSFCSFSQDDLVVFGIIRDKDNQSKLEGVQCQVQQDNGTYDAVATNKNGKYEFDMPLGYVYKFKFSMNNYVHKIILVDTKNMYSEDHKGGFEMNMDITLFKMVDGFDTSIMDEPFGKAKFDNIKNDLVFDFAYTEKQNFKVEDELDRLEDAEKNKEKNQKEFDQLMAKGSDKMLEDKYSEAISKFKAALKIFPTDQTAKDKLAEAEQALADSKKDKEKDSKYQKFLTEGNKEFKNENWAEAKMNYEKALEVKPGEQIPKDKIKEIEKIITSMLQRGDFNELVDAGDRLFEDEEYEKAIEKYSSALEIFSNESHPRDQIQKAQTIMNDLANAEKEAEAKEKEYNDLIKFAQKNFKAGEYEAARDKYVSAGKIKPEETMPPKKIEEIDKLLAELAEEKAREDQENAENAEKDKIEAEYQAFIDKANDFFKDKEFEKAKVEYENALGVKANDVFAERKIETINDILSELAEKEKEDEAQNEAQAEQDRIDKEYEAYKAEADNLFDAEKYEEAKEKYNLALGVKSGEKYPKSRIQRIDEILAQMETEAEDDALALELAKKKQEEEDARLAEEKRREEELAEKERLLQEKRDQEKDEANKDDRVKRDYSTIDASSDDKVVKYYRDARKSEDLAKIDEVNDVVSRNNKMHENMQSSTNLQRQDNQKKVDDKQKSLETIKMNGADNHQESLRSLNNKERENQDNKKRYQNVSDQGRNRNINEVSDDRMAQESLIVNDRYREDRVESNNDMKEQYQKQQVKFNSNGDSGRMDNVFEIERVQDKLVNIENKAEDKRQESISKSVNDQERYQDFENDLNQSSEVRRESAKAKISETRDGHEKMMSKQELYRVEAQSKIDEKKDSQDDFLQGMAIDSEMRRIDALNELNAKDSGGEKDPEDYILQSGSSDVRYGVSETSKEQGNKTIIERTVRDGNIIDIYKKVISKTGIYYFKNGSSCTEDTWEIETVKVFD